MDNIMDKVFKIVYLVAYAINGLMLVLYLLLDYKLWLLIMTYAVISIILAFLGYLIQEHLDNIIQLYLIIVGVVTILAVFMKPGFWDKVSLGILGAAMIGIAFLLDEFFEADA